MIEVKTCTDEQSKDTFDMYAKVINIFKPIPVHYRGDWLSIEESYDPAEGSLFLIATDSKSKNSSVKKEEILGCMGVKRYGEIAILKHVAVDLRYQGTEVEIQFNNERVKRYEKQYNIAKFLLEELEKFCISQGIGTLIIGTDSYYPSGLKFYEKNNYSPLEESHILDHPDIYCAYQDYKDIDDTWLIKKLSYNVI
ncbi:hypothetical protein QR692_04115 [Lactococcus petauri]|jgi:GNAT superfamily N-acetyltransferase|uniref:hypothetical protein n=1 Tax=Lactococcus petauri TaxID=1940789 RepID=UPI002078A04C|nr:hypothetical protein [Lactococcus petauri]USI68936.1 hypothetical protein LMK04_04165 [Lactococcus petauri]WJE13599.1 hypothetical protein QR692_04115 [Lactococcus petauri]